MENKCLVNDNQALVLAKFYQIMADKTRLKIVYALIQKPLCVNEISNTVNMSQTAVSYQLKILRTSRLVKYKRIGKKIIYSIEDDHVADIIKISIEHLNHESIK